MNDIWQFLGTEPTNDKKEIRRAYAAQSKLHHPEEEPEYFAELNQAYRQALNEAVINETTVSQTAFELAGERESVEESGQQYSHMEEEHDDTAEPSLLDRLYEAEQQKIRKSMQEGALHDFTELFENPKQAKQKDTWKRFFFSEAFLGEQFSEEFARGLLGYLTEQQHYPYDNLPMGLLEELAIAYAFIPHSAGEEYFEGVKYPKEWYKVSVENTFPARKHMAEIFNMQGRDCDLKSVTRHILRQPANKVRHNAFTDYLTVKEMNRNGQLTEEESEKWRRILRFAQVFYLFERNGKKPGSGGYESRSECVVKLYTQWLKDEQIPECILKFIYKEFAFRELEHSSTKGLYRALKEQVLLQMPDVEEILFGEDGNEQKSLKVYRVCAGIINDNQNNYEKSIYEETPEIQERVKALFAMPEWESVKKDRTLFEKLYSGAKRLVMPRSLSEGLIRYLMEGDFPEPRRTELTESLLRSLATERMCRELDYLCELPVCHTHIDEIGDDNADFWQYFLMRGFGYRHVPIRGGWEAEYIYETGGQCYLPAYINYIYAPSRAWQRAFVGFDEEKECIASPVSATCSMPDGRWLRVEFHYHFCLYFVNGIQVITPVLSFHELEEYAQKIERSEGFFYLLAVTSIEDSERERARALIGRWLEKVPIHPFICPLIARLLAADNDRLTEEADTVLYEEQERFCFRAVVSKERRKEVRIFRQADFCWQDIIFRRVEFGWKEFPLPAEIRKEAEEGLVFGFEERKGQAVRALKLLRQPQPQCSAVYAVDGMDMRQKTETILEAMKYAETSEGYCILRYGDKKYRRHDRVFYGAQIPFGFCLKVQSSEYERSMHYLMSSSNTKIKERKRPVARFGWGFKYSHKSDYGPMCVYLGESGRYFAYGTIRMHRADNLTDLLVDFYAHEFEGVTEVESYEGCLSVSRLDHRLEYCYSENDYLQSIHSTEDTDADLFTVFGGRRMWMEFRGWMDRILAQGLPEWVNTIAVGFNRERGDSLRFAGQYIEAVCADDYDEEWEEDFSDDDTQTSGGNISGEDEEDNEMEQTSGEDEVEHHEPYLPEVPLLVWEKNLDEADRRQSLYDAVQWYLECGEYAGVIKNGGLEVFVNTDFGCY